MTHPPGARRALAILAVAEFLGMSAWLTASAVSPELARRWALDAQQTGWLTSIVQLGFVTGTAAVALLNLGDIWPSRRLFAGGALLAAGANALLLAAPGYRAALALRFVTGLALAGVYPPAMKMIATWYESARGFAIGVVVGALTLGKATPYLVHAFARDRLAPVILAASAGAVLAAILVLAAYRDGPFAFTRRPFSWSLVVEVVRERRWQLATAGYLGHMWELYAFWTWVAVFVAAAAAGAGRGRATADIVAYGAIGIGAIGAVWGGLVADRIGHAKLVTIALAASGSLAIVAALLLGSSFPAFAIVTLAWGFFVIADSAQFSTLVTRAVPTHAVGTALTLQTSLGFLLTMASIQLMGVVASRTGWPSAMAMLAVGPAFGIAAVKALRRDTATR